MSKSSRNQPVAFPADAPVIDAESTVDASEAPETSESASEPLLNTPEAASGGPIPAEMVQREAEKVLEREIPGFRPTPVESISSQHEVAQHIAALLAEEGAEMATLEPPPSEKVDLEAELDAIVTSGAVTLPDGSIRIPIIVPQEQCEILRAWADGAGEPFETYLQTIVEMGLNALITGGAVAG